MSEQDLFRLLGLSLSSPSASDLSEGVSDMSLSTSPGSDCPQHARQPNTLSNGKTTNSGGEVGGTLGNGDGGGTAETESGPKPRRKLVARQLSSNPYLASSSSLDDHNPVTPAASFAFGDNQYEEPQLPLRSCSFPAAGEYVENLAHHHQQQQQYNQIHNLSNHDNRPLSHDQYYSNVVNGNVHGYYPPAPTRTPCSNTRTTPPETVPHDMSSLPRSVNSWGHFSRSSYNRYKYRRSDYSSDSDEDSHPSPPQLPHKISSSLGLAPQPHTCLSEYQHISSNSNHKSATDTKKDHNHFSEGVRPNVFKERFAVSMVSSQFM